MFKLRNVILATLLIGFTNHAFSFSVQENQPSGTVVGTVTINDNNGNYGLGGADLNHFSISTTGVLTTSSVFDYESRTSYSVTVTRMVYDPVQVASKSVSISITNDPSDDNLPQQQPQTPAPQPQPAALSFSVQENRPRGTTVGTVTITGNSGDYLMGGTDMNSFSIDATSGVLTTNAVFDYESRTSYSVMVSRMVFDPVQMASKSVSISITNDTWDDPLPREQPQATTIQFSVRENIPIGTNVGQPVTTISLDGIPQNLRSQAVWVMRGSGASSFSINENTGQLKTAVVLDFERQSGHNLVVAKNAASNGMMYYGEERHIRVTVIDTLEPPSSSMSVPTYPNRPVEGGVRYLSVGENQPVGTVLTYIGVTQTAQFSTTNREVYALDGRDAGAFKLVDIDANRMGIVTAKVFDYETQKRHSFRAVVRSTIGTKNFLISPFVVDIMDDPSDNFPPVRPTPQNVKIVSISENTAVGTTITTVTSSQSGNWGMASGEANIGQGEADMNHFSITISGEIKTIKTFDYDVKNRYSLIVYRGTTGVKNVIVNITRAVSSWGVGEMIPDFSKKTSRTWGSYYGDTLTENGVTWHCSPPQSPPTCYVFHRVVQRGTITVVQAAPSAPIALAWEDAKRRAVQLRTGQVPKETKLLANYPNPFNPETWIPYRLAEAAEVALTIYDADGQVVRTIDVGHRTAAVYESRSKAIYWDGKNTVGEQVASGVYFYNLQAGDYSQTRKMLVVK